MPRNTVWILPKKTRSGGTGPCCGWCRPPPDQQSLPRRPFSLSGRPSPIAGTRLRTALGRGTGAPPPRTRAPPGQASGTGKALVRFLLHRKTSYTLFRNEGASSCRNFMESTARNSRRPREFLLPSASSAFTACSLEPIRPSALTPSKATKFPSPGSEPPPKWSTPKPVRVKTPPLPSVRWPLRTASWTRRPSSTRPSPCRPTSTGWARWEKYAARWTTP